jgi:murein DD-endopeptidase MepM/ murein hydrolase activator NlpD
MTEMIVPVTGKITSPFGWRNHPIKKSRKFHNGVDIAAKLGTPVKAPADGKVDTVWNDTTYGGGLSLIVKHYNGFKTGYCHLSEQLVKSGQIVKQGEIIAKVGSTGASTGPHLHFTLTNFAGEKVDPTKEIKF